MPSGATGQLLTFKQNNVGPAQLCQVISNRTAADAAPDDDRARFAR